jgi:hypothetical protein
LVLWFAYRDKLSVSLCVFRAPLPHSASFDSPNEYSIPLEKVGRNDVCVGEEPQQTHALEEHFETSMSSYDSDGDGAEDVQHMCSNVQSVRRRCEEHPDASKSLVKSSSRRRRRQRRRDRVSFIPVATVRWFGRSFSVHLALLRHVPQQCILEVTRYPNTTLEKRGFRIIHCS